MKWQRCESKPPFRTYRTTYWMIKWFHRWAAGRIWSQAWGSWRERRPCCSTRAWRATARPKARLTGSAVWKTKVTITHTHTCSHNPKLYRFCKKKRIWKACATNIKTRRRWCHVLKWQSSFFTASCMNMLELSCFPVNIKKSFWSLQTYVKWITLPSPGQKHFFIKCENIIINWRLIKKSPFKKIRRENRK